MENHIKYSRRVLEGRTKDIDMDAFERGLSQALRGARYVSHNENVVVDQETQRKYGFELNQGLFDRLAGRIHISSDNGVSGTYLRARNGEKADLCLFMAQGKAPQFYRKI